MPSIDATFTTASFILNIPSEYREKIYFPVPVYRLNTSVGKYTVSGSRKLFGDKLIYVFGKSLVYNISFCAGSGLMESKKAYTGESI